MALDDIPGMVRSDGPVDYDAASAAMNDAADRLNASHDMEYSVTLRVDSRANLFTNVAGYMLRNPRSIAGLTDAEIVDAAILAGYSSEEADETDDEMTERVRGWSD
jgi:hypothetical protein